MQFGAAVGERTTHFTLCVDRNFHTIEERGDTDLASSMAVLSGIRNDDLFFSIRTERRDRGVRTDEIAQPQLIVGVHEDRINPEPRLIRPAYGGQSYRQRLGLSRKMQMQLKQIPGLQPFESGS